MPTISVITAVHPERAQHLSETYESVAAQSLPTGWILEWLVQQDGAGTAARSYLPEDDSRVRFGQSRFGGPATARNMALARATGQLVRVLDADDQLTMDALARDIAAMEGHQSVGWTTSRVLDLLPDGSTVGFDHDPPEGVLALGDVIDHWTAHDYRAQVHPATLCVERTLLLMLGGWMALPASEDTGLLLALNAVSLGYFTRAPGLLYRKWAGQSTAIAAHTDPSERADRMTVIAARARTLRRYIPLNDAVLALTNPC